MDGMIVLTTTVASAATTAPTTTVASGATTAPTTTVASGATTAPKTAAATRAAATTDRTTVRVHRRHRHAMPPLTPAPSVGDQMALRPEGGLRAIAHPELREHTREMCLHRLLADLQLARYQLVGLAARYELEDVELARAQVRFVFRADTFSQHFSSRTGRERSI